MNKNKILRELYYGNLRPVEGQIKKRNPCYELSDEIDSLVGSIEKLLDEEGNKQMQKCVEGYGKLLYLNSEERFIQGFKLGGKLAIEMLINDDEIKV